MKNRNMSLTFKFVIIYVPFMMVVTALIYYLNRTVNEKIYTGIMNLSSSKIDFNKLKKCMRDSIDNANKMNIFLLFLIFAGVIILTYFISNATSKKMKISQKTLEALSSGDFTVQLEKKILNDRTEIGAMVKSIDKTQNQISTLVNNIRNNAGIINTKTNILDESVNNTNKMCSNISKSIDEVATGVSVQSQNIVEISDNLNNYNNMFEDMKKLFADLKMSSDTIYKKSSDGNKEIEGLVTSIKKFNNEFENYNKLILQVDKEIKEVNKMADIINSISEETNLLALNAAIEAARAGEAGKGFAVVADEIRKLAEVSKESTEQIYSIVSNVLNSTKNIVDKTKDMNKEIRIEENSVKNTIEAFKEITISINEVDPIIVSMNNSFSELDKNRDNITAELGDLSTVAEQITANAEEVSATTQELYANISDVAVVSKNLSELTETINRSMSRFKVLEK